MRSHRGNVRLKLVVGLAVLLFLAGCSMSAPFADDSEAPLTPTPDTDADTAAGTAGNDTSDQSVADGEDSDGTADDDGPGPASDSIDSAEPGPLNNSALPVDVARVYNQTRELLNSDAEPPSVEVNDLGWPYDRRTDPFFEFLGLTNDTEGGDGSTVSAAGLAPGPDSVEIDDQYATENLTTRQRQSLELVLAHEFTHTIQFEERWWSYQFGSPASWDGEPAADSGTIEYTLLVRSLVEGGAGFAADGYATEVGYNVSELRSYEQSYRRAVPAEQYTSAPYYHGSQYFDAVLDSPEELGTVYENAPTTTAELLHPNRTDFEPTPVAFNAEGNAPWYPRTELHDRGGELFVHVVLSAYTDVETADEAAAGWVNDRVFAFGYSDNLSYAWPIHWESAEDANEFAAAFNGTLDARDDEAASQVGLRLVGNRTVVVTAGSRDFREAISIQRKNATIDIVVGAAEQQQTQQARYVSKRQQPATLTPASTGPVAGPVPFGVERDPTGTQ